jgi:hypothetical protein
MPFLANRQLMIKPSWAIFGTGARKQGTGYVSLLDFCQLVPKALPLDFYCI